MAKSKDILLSQKTHITDIEKSSISTSSQPDPLVVEGQQVDELNVADPSIRLNVTIENAVSRKGLFKYIVDNLSLSDSVELFTSAVSEKDLADTTSISEAISFQFNAVRNFVETLNVSESIALGIGAVKLDTFNTSDTSSRGVGKNLTDSANFSDSLRSDVGKGLSDQTSLSDVFSRTVEYNRSFTETLSIYDVFNSSAGGGDFYNTTDSLGVSELISFDVNKYFEDSIDLAEVIQLSVGKIFEETVTIGDNYIVFNVDKGLLETLTVTEIVTKDFEKNLSPETVAISDDISLSPKKNLQEILSASEEISKDIGLTLLDVLSVSDIFNSQLSGAGEKNVTDSTSVSEDISLDVGKILSDVLSGIDSSIISIGVGKGITETLNLSEDIVRSVGKSFTETLAVSEVFTRQWAAVRDFQDNTTISELISLGAGKVLEESVVATETTSKDIGKSAEEILSLSESISKDIGLTLLDTVYITELFDAASEEYEIFSEYMLTSEFISFQWDAVRNYIETLNLSESIAKDVGKELSNETVTTSETVSKDIALNFLDILSITDVFNASASGDLTHSPTDTSSISDLIALDVGKIFNESLSVGDTFVLDMGKFFTETLSLSDSQIKDIGKIETDTLILSDSDTKDIGKFDTETLSLSENITKDIGLNLTDVLSISDVFNYDYSGGFQENYSDFLTGVTELIAFEFGKELSDTADVSDSISIEPGLVKSDATSINPPSGSTYIDSASDIIERADANLPSSTLMTVSGWTRASTISTDDGLFTLREATNRYYQASIWSSNEVYALTYYDGTLGDYIWGDTKGPGNDWFYWAFVCSGSGANDAKFYWWNQAGTLFDIGSGEGFTMNPTYLRIGEEKDGNFVTGYFSEIRVWDAALTTTELLAEMKSRVPVRTTNLNSAWDGGDPTVDVSGNNRPFSVTNTTSSTEAPSLTFAAKDVGKVLPNDVLALSESVTTQWDAVRAFQENLSLAESISKDIGLNFTDTLSVTDVFNYDFSGGGFTETPTDVLTGVTESLSMDYEKNFDYAKTGVGLISMSATGHYFRRSTNIPDPSVGFGMSAWFRRRGTGGGSWNYMFSINDDSGSQSNLEYNVSTYALSAGGSNICTLSGPWLDEWLYIALASNGSNLSGYVWNASGTLLGSTTSGTLASFTPTNMEIGGSSFYGSDWFNGDVSCWKIYDSSQTQAQFEANMFTPEFINSGTQNSYYIDTDQSLHTPNRVATTQNVTFKGFGNENVNLSSMNPDGSSRYYHVNISGQATYNSFTMSGWARLNEFDGTWGIIASFGRGDSDNRCAIGVNTSNQFVIWSDSGGPTAFNAQPEAGQWFYWKMYSTGNVSGGLVGYLYDKDGNLIDMQSCVGPAVSTFYQVTIGNDVYLASSTYYWNGQVANVRLWNNYPQGGPETRFDLYPSPSSNLKLAINTTTYDFSGNDNHMTNNIAKISDRTPPIFHEDVYIEESVAKDATKQILYDIADFNSIEFIPGSETNGQFRCERTANFPSITSVSMCGWFRRTGGEGDIGGGNAEWLLGMTDHSTGWQGLACGGTADTELRLGGWTGTAAFASQPNNNEWFFAAWTCASAGAGAMKGYWWDQSGNVQTTTRTPDSYTPTKMFVCNANNGGYRFEGNAAHVRIFDTELTQTQLEAEMRSTRPVYTANLNCAFNDDPEHQDFSGNERYWNTEGMKRSKLTPQSFQGSVVVDQDTDSIERTANLPSMTNMTMAGWMKLDATTDSVSVICSLIDSTGGDYRNLRIFDTGASTMALQMFNSGNADSLIADFSNRFHNWVYVAITSAGDAIGDVKAYCWDLYGNLIGSVSNTATTTSDTSAYMEIGNLSNFYADRAAMGEYHNWRVWDAVLGQNELYAESRRSAPNRVADLNTAFSSGVGKDISGNNRGWSGTAGSYATDAPPVYTNALNPYRQQGFLQRSSNLPSMTNFSASGWVKIDGTNGQSYQTIFLIRNSGDTVARAVFVNNGLTDIRAMATGDTQQLLSPVTSYYGNWLYFAVSCSGTAAGNYKAYIWDVNGNLLGSSTNSGVISTDTPAAIDLGNNTIAFSEHLNGSLYNWKVWDAVLSQSEFETELKSVDIVRITNINTAFISDGEDISDNGYDWYHYKLDGINEQIPEHFETLYDTADVSDIPSIEPTKNIVAKDQEAISYWLVPWDGGAALFDSGTAECHRDIAVPSMQSFSFGAWIYWMGSNGNTYQIIYNLTDQPNDGGGAGGHYWRLIMVTNNAGTMELRYGSQAAQITMSTTFAADAENKWVYVALSGAGNAIGDLKAYMWDASGTLLDSDSNTATLGSSVTPMWHHIGSWIAYPDEWFNGYIANARVWDEVLSQTDFETEMFSKRVVKKEALNSSFNHDPEKDIEKGRPWNTTDVTIINNEIPTDHGVCDASGETFYRSANLPSTTAFTAVGWFNRQGNGAADSTMISLRNSSSGHGIDIEWHQATGFFDLYCSGSTANNDDASVDFSSYYLDWIFVAVTSDATDITAYIFNKSGALLDTLTIAHSAVGSMDTPDRLNYAGDAFGEWFNGWFAHGRVWDAALTLTEVRREMFSPRPVRMANINTTFTAGNGDLWSGNNRNWTRTTSSQNQNIIESIGMAAPVDCLYTDGTANNVFSRTANLPTPSAISVGVWVYLLERDSQTVFSFGDSAGNEGVNLLWSTAGGTHFRLGNEHGNDAISTPGGADIGQWYYVAATQNGTGTNTVTGYAWDRFGRFMGQVSRDGYTYTMYSIRMAGFFPNGNNNYPAYGYYRHGRVWDAVLTKAEFEAEMVSESIVRTANINTAFRNTHKDISGNGRDWPSTEWRGAHAGYSINERFTAGEYVDVAESAVAFMQDYMDTSTYFESDYIGANYLL